MKTKFKIKDISDFPDDTGIYYITFINNSSQKKYIGSASANTSKIKSGRGFYNRWKRHAHMLRNNNHHSVGLQNAYNKYGEDNIEFVILERCKPSECISKEQFYIDKFNSFNKGYNGRPTADSNLGYKQTDEHKNKIKNKYKAIRDVIAKDVIELYNQNKTTREISEELRISRNYIKRIFRENKVKPKNTAFYKKKKIYQYDLDGKLIEEFDSIRGCAESLCMEPISIRQVLKKIIKQSNGFYFNLEKIGTNQVLKNMEELTRIPINKKYINIKQIDADGNFIKTWKDVRTIIDSLGYSSNGPISKAIRDRKKYKGFYWTLE